MFRRSIVLECHPSPSPLSLPIPLPLSKDRQRILKEIQEDRERKRAVTPPTASTSTTTTSSMPATSSAPTSPGPTSPTKASGDITIQVDISATTANSLPVRFGSRMASVVVKGSPWMRQYPMCLHSRDSGRGREWMRFNCYR